MQAFRLWLYPFQQPQNDKKRITKLVFIYVKEPRLKSLTWRTLGFSEYGRINASIVSLPLPLTATPKGVIKGNKIDMYSCKKKSNAKTNVISYLRVPEYGMTNGSNLRVAFTTDSTPKRGKKGQQKKYTCVKRVKAKTGVTSHLISVSRVRNN